MIHRRRWLAGVLASTTALSSGILAGHRGQAAPANLTDGLRLTRVKSVLEVKGDVKLKNYRSKNAADQKTAPIEAKSVLEYEEAYRVGSASSSGTDDAAYQIYHQAELDNRIEKHATQLHLREDCRELVRKSVDGKMETVCLHNPLTAAEHDLVQGPLATMYLEQLLPTHSIKLGESWEVDSEIVTKLLHWDTITSGTIQVTLIDINDTEGQLAIQGKLQGEIRSVETKIELEGKAKIDRKAKLIAWLAMSLQEDRSVSEAEPGFTIQARLRVLRESIPTLSTGRSLAEVESEFNASNATKLFKFESKLGAYQFVADRSWTVYNDSGVDATIRWIQKDRVVAQCMITNMSDMEPGRQLSIEGYQNDIQKALGKRFGQFLEADERISQTGLRMMRVVTVGQVESVPVQWIHILLSNDAGRHLALAYSMNTSSVESFGSNDLQMAGSLEFTLRELPKAPNEASQDQAKKDEAPKSAAKTTEPTPARR